MSKKAWISAGKVSLDIAAIALLLGAVFQVQAQQSSDIADVRAKLRSGFAQVNECSAQVDARLCQMDFRFAQVDDRFAQMDGRSSKVNSRLDSIDSRLWNLRERVARVEGHLVLRAGAGFQANSAL